MLCKQVEIVFLPGRLCHRVGIGCTGLSLLQSQPTVLGGSDSLRGHPLPKTRLRALEQSLEEGKEADQLGLLVLVLRLFRLSGVSSPQAAGNGPEADWRILKNIPAFCSCAYQPFLARLHKATEERRHLKGGKARRHEPARSVFLGERRMQTFGFSAWVTWWPSRGAGSSSLI